MRLFKCLFLGCALFATTVVGSMCWANDYKFFSIDLPENWEEIEGENFDADAGTYQVIFSSADQQSILLMTSTSVDKNLDLSIQDQLEIFTKMTDGMVENGMTIKTKEYVNNGGFYKVTGTLEGEDAEIHIFAMGKVVFMALAMGEDKKSSFSMLKTFRVRN